MGEIGVVEVGEPAAEIAGVNNKNLVSRIDDPVVVIAVAEVVDPETSQASIPQRCKHPPIIDHIVCVHHYCHV